MIQNPPGSVAQLESWLSSHVANWSALGTEQRIDWVVRAERSLRDQAAYGVDRPAFILDWKYAVLGREARFYCHREDFE